MALLKFSRTADSQTALSFLEYLPVYTLKKTRIGATEGFLNRNKQRSVLFP